MSLKSNFKTTQESVKPPSIFVKFRNDCSVFITFFSFNLYVILEQKGKLSCRILI